MFTLTNYKTTTFRLFIFWWFYYYVSLKLVCHISINIRLVNFTCNIPVFPIFLPRICNCNRYTVIICKIYYTISILVITIFVHHKSFFI